MQGLRRVSGEREDANPAVAVDVAISIGSSRPSGRSRACRAWRRFLSEPFSDMSSGSDARYLLEGQASEEQSRQPLLNFENRVARLLPDARHRDSPRARVTDEDCAQGRPVLILSESAARLAWLGKDAVGERMKISGSPWATVIGAAADTCYRELTVFRPTVYWPPAQFEAAPGFLAVRTAGDPIALAAAIRNAGQAASPGVTFSSLRRLDDYSSEPLARSRVTAALFAGIGGAALAALFSGWLESILYGVSTLVGGTRCGPSGSHTWKTATRTTSARTSRRSREFGKNNRRTSSSVMSIRAELTFSAVEVDGVCLERTTPFWTNAESE